MRLHSRFKNQRSSSQFSPRNSKSIIRCPPFQSVSSWDMTNSNIRRRALQPTRTKHLLWISLSARRKTPNPTFLLVSVLAPKQWWVKQKSLRMMKICLSKNRNLVIVMTYFRDLPLIKKNDLKLIKTLRFLIGAHWSISMIRTTYSVAVSQHFAVRARPWYFISIKSSFNKITRNFDTGTMSLNWANFRVSQDHS